MRQILRGGFRLRGGAEFEFAFICNDDEEPKDRVVIAFGHVSGQTRAPPKLETTKAWQHATLRTAIERRFGSFMEIDGWKVEML
jgi:hypothetical protein